MGVLKDIARWLWHLLPGNPILLRVIAAAGKRKRHLFVRFAYLAVLVIVVFVLGSSVLSTQAASLAELAKKATVIFMGVSLVQLFLMSFVAPVFAAGAITQEKDANTFHILLTTPLSNAQIVLGTLFSRLFFVWVLLLSGLPIFCITMLYGGVTGAEVFQSFGLAACTGLVTGSLAIMISVARVGTRRTIFSFFLGVALYLLAVYAIGASSYGLLAEAPSGTGFFVPKMSWLAPVHPLLALLVVTGQTPAPPLYAVQHYGWPWSWLLANPEYGYMWITTLASTLMILISLFFVRRGAKEGETNLWKRLRAFFSGGSADGERRRRPRTVWSNPIAWREAATRASAGGRSLLRWAFIGGGVLIGLALLAAHEQKWLGMNPSAPGTTRDWLTSVAWIELGVILLVVTNTAATTLTREKESLTIELLLVTPLTSKYIIAGMLRGLVSFALPMIAVPASMLLIFVFADLVRSGPSVTTPEALLLAPLQMTACAALAAMTGLYFSLQSKKTVQAVMTSTALVMLAAVLLWGCGLTVRSGGGGVFAAVVQPLSPFHSVQILIDPLSAFSPRSGTPSASELLAVRWTRLLFSLISTAAYAGATYWAYNGMVRSFDMTVRRQTA